jgi:hypothetical protein
MVTAYRGAGKICRKTGISFEKKIEIKTFL